MMRRPGIGPGNGSPGPAIRGLTWGHIEYFFEP